MSWEVNEFQLRKGITEIEGKATRVGASESGQRASFNRANGVSEIEGKATRVVTTEPGQRRSFNGVRGPRDIEGKAARVAARGIKRNYHVPIDASEWRATIEVRCSGKGDEKAITLKTLADQEAADALCWAAESGRSFS